MKWFAALFLGVLLAIFAWPLILAYRVYNTGTLWDRFLRDALGVCGTLAWHWLLLSALLHQQMEMYK